MLLTIIRKEITAHILSLRFAVTFVLFLLLILSSLVLTIAEHKREQALLQERVHTYDEALRDITKEKDDWRRWGRLIWDEGKNDAVRGSDLAWLGQGLQPGYPVALNTRIFAVQAVDRGLSRNPLQGLLRIPDFIYVVSSVLSLLAVLFMFDAICGEKERGTLRLMLSNAVPRHTVLLGKWIGGYLTLLVPFLLATAGGLVYAHSQGVLQGADMTRVLVLVVVACAYIAVFFNLSLFVSTTTNRAATALLICLLAWVLCILVVPNLAPVTAKIVAPTVSPEKIRAAKRAVDEEIELKKRRLTLISGELSYGQRIEDEREKLERERQRLKKKYDRRFEASRSSQMELAQTLGRLSPAACWTYAASSLTNTGTAAYGKLVEARRRLELDFTQWEKDMQRRRRASGKREPPSFKPEDVPALHFNLPAEDEAIRAALNDILVLVILNVVFFMLSFTFFLRYDVR